MDVLLVNLVAFVRPFVSMAYAEAFFEVLGMALFALAWAGLLIAAAVKQTIRLSAIDLLILAFSVWCVAIYIIYFESAQVKYLLKLVLPMLGYTVVKNSLHMPANYRRMLLWIIAGSTLPVLLSTVLIVTGHSSGIDMVNYWTQVTRWKGAYNHSHTLGHVMALLLITIVIYVRLRSAAETGTTKRRTITAGNIFLALLSIAALYCLYMSAVRSALLGLMVFIAVYLALHNRKAFILGSIGFAVIAVATVPYWLAPLLPEIATQQKGVEVDIMEMGSGRPQYWLHDITLFAELPFDRKLAGAGLGSGDASAGIAAYDVKGHNDWLELLLQTGIVGFLLFAAVQLLILRAIFKMPKTERYLFLSFALAIDVMMLVSNSYAWRIQVSQLAYMILAFIELPRQEPAPEPVPAVQVASPIRAYKAIRPM